MTNTNKNSATLGWIDYAEFAAFYGAVFLTCCGFAYAMLYPVFLLLEK